MKVRTFKINIIVSITYTALLVFIFMFFSEAVGMSVVYAIFVMIALAYFF